MDSLLKRVGSITPSGLSDNLGLTVAALSMKFREAQKWPAKTLVTSLHDLVGLK